MAYLGKTPSQAVRSRYYFTASGGETSLAPAQVTGLSFTDANYVDVSLNGVALVSGTDYTATPSTNTISSLSVLTASDVVEIVVYDTFSVFGGSVNGDFNISSGDLTLGDNDKAIFGAGSDLQIYHDGSNSYVRDNGTGVLTLQGTNQVKIQSPVTGENYAIFNDNGAVTLNYDNSLKFATNANGVDVTGTVTADGLTVDGTSPAVATFNSTSNGVRIEFNGASTPASRPWEVGVLNNADGDFQIYQAADAGAGDIKFYTDGTLRQNIDAQTGDISFYADNGTTQGLFWDASTQRLGLGTTSPDGGLDIEKTVNTAWSSALRANDFLQISNASTTGGSYSGIELIATGVGAAGAAEIVCIDSGSGSGDLAFSTRNSSTWSEKVRILAGGNVGIGTSSPGRQLHVKSSNATVMQVESTNASIAQMTFVSDGAASNPAIGAIDDTAFNIQTGNVERMRIDSNGNLLVGHTSVFSPIGNGGSGVTATASGQLFAGHAGPPLYVNREDSDGDIAIFRKDGTTVGNIGASNGNLFIEKASNSGFQFGSSGQIVPRNSGAISDNTVDLGSSSTRFDDIFATNGTIQTSDQQEKNTITDSDLGLDFINRLSPKSYIFNGKTRTHYGLIAQDVETVLGDISKPTSGFAGFIKSDISEEEDGSEYRYGLRYTEFVGPLIQAVKDLKAENDAMRARLTALENAE